MPFNDKHINPKIIVAAVIGTGLIVGVGTAFFYRINSHLNHLVSHLQTTIKEVKDDLTILENELCELQGPAAIHGGRPSRSRCRKTVSFSSSASGSYKTPPSNQTFTASIENDTLSDTASWRTAVASYDTDYFSPDEDNEEFFDLAPDDEIRPMVQKSNEEVSNEVSDFSNLLKHVDILINKSPEEQREGYHLIIDSAFDNNAEILWRKARACRNLAMIEEQNENRKGKQDYINEGYNFARKALEINGNSAEVHKWFAILSGSRGEFLSTRERIESGQEFKKHLDIAIQICPNDSTLYHLLGRFCYEVSMLSWVERKIASTLFGEVPSSSFEEALGQFMSAEELNCSEWKENKLYVAKCLLQMHRNCEAESWLKIALNIPTVTADDAIIDKEIKSLAAKYNLSL